MSDIGDSWTLWHNRARAGKSSKMSERGFLLGLKCPQSYLNEIPQNWQFLLILHNFQPQNKL